MGDTIKDTYVYTKFFKHNSDQLSSSFNGHPKAGKIYKATLVESGDKPGWRIHLNDVAKDGLKGIWTKNLVEITDLWSHEFYEVDQNVIENEDISDEELKKLVEWESDPTEDGMFLEEADLGSEEEEMEEEDELRDFYAETFEWMELVRQRDMPMFDALMGFVHFVGKTYLDKYQSSPLPTRAMLANGEQGKGANMLNAAKYISRYINTGASKAENPVDLFKSAHYLMFELARISEETNKQIQKEAQRLKNDKNGKSREDS